MTKDIDATFGINYAVDMEQFNQFDGISFAPIAVAFACRKLGFKRADIDGVLLIVATIAVCLTRARIL